MSIDDFLPITTLFDSANMSVSEESEIEPLGKLDETLKFGDWTLIASGTHARIYRAKQAGVDNSPYYCVKLFRRGWMTPFNLEKTAYEYLQAAKIENYIPLVHGYDHRTLSEWGLPFGTDDDQLYYAIVMEWIENGEQLSPENITLSSACMLLTGLEKVHAAGVLHWDTYKRNLMVVSDTSRGVWIDFSCALIGQDRYHAQEMASAQALILEMVSPSLNAWLTALAPGGWKTPWSTRNNFYL
jgi:RIO-like serine/threonine protein kinase